MSFAIRLSILPGLSELRSSACIEPITDIEMTCRRFVDWRVRELKSLVGPRWSCRIHKVGIPWMAGTDCREISSDCIASLLEMRGSTQTTEQDVWRGFGNERVDARREPTAFGCEDARWIITIRGTARGESGSTHR
jgi:hypothetical protein